ncbi:MAG TPA: GreA/GreB family elongation factor [Planctomycetota bacterium]|nr:GreA/GreB family elongation factor [Planctomycetota bacterium]
MSLTILVAQERWQEFDQTWKAALDAGDTDVSDLTVALDLAGNKKRIARCVAMAKKQANKLVEADAHGDAARVLGAALCGGGNPTELAGDLYSEAFKAWSEEPWWAAICEASGFSGESPNLRGAWSMFEKLRSLGSGALIYHGGGWGVGEVTEVDALTQEIVISFAGGRSDRFPFATAADIFELLGQNDLRARYFRDAEGTTKAVKKDPLEALLAVVDRHHGRASLVAVRTALAQVGVEGSAWTAWWRKTHKLAGNCEWLRVSGTKSRAVVERLLEAKDPAEDLARRLRLISKIEEVINTVRDLFIGSKVEPEVREAALTALEERLAQPDCTDADLLTGWIILRHHREASPAALTERLTECMGAEQPATVHTRPALWGDFQLVRGYREQEQCVELLKELYGEEKWLDEAGANLQHASPGMVRALVDALLEKGHGKALAAQYTSLLARPLRAPDLLVTLARLAETGRIEGSFPAPLRRAQALVNLATHLWAGRRGNQALTRVNQRLATLLARGESPALKTLLAEATVDDLRSFHLQAGRGVDDAIEGILTEIAFDLDRNFFAGASTHFWEGEAVWTSRDGLERRAADLREIRDVKIPANEDAIGAAAAFGDLSENSEWEAAMEEQRNLTSRAMDMEAELRHTDLIANAVIPEDTICPGTRVTYRETESNETRAIRVLGPWDGYLGDDVVSYRAPLAASMLGLHTGDQAVLDLPAGKLDIEVTAIELLDIE